jgi:anti-anti-sigma factor
MMNITFQELEDRFLVSLEGKIDSAACAEVEKTLQPIYTSAGKDVYIDCENLLFIASAGLRVLLIILKKCRADGNKVVILKPSDYIKEVFTITGFINFLEIRE